MLKANIISKCPVVLIDSNYEIKMKGRVTQKNFKKQLRKMAEIQRKETAFRFSIFRGVYNEIVKYNVNKKAED